MTMTPRAGGLIGAGAAISVLSVLLDQRDLLRVGLLLLVLVGSAFAWAPLRRGRLEVARTVSPSRISQGESAVVDLRVHNTGSRRATGRRLTDHLDPDLGAAVPLAVPALAPGAAADVSYSVRPWARGVYRVGPVSSTTTDPFHLVEDVVIAVEHDLLVVTPAVARLPGATDPAQPQAEGPISSRRHTVRGEDDIGTRTYRVGDELRRVHWPATARTGTLMVREEQHLARTDPVVLLDNRAAAHRAVHRPTGPGTTGPGTTERGTTGPGADPADTSSLEWAVHAAASLCVHLGTDGRPVRLITAEHDPGPTGIGPGTALDVLAGLVPSEASTLDRFVPASLRPVPPSLVVAVLGALTGTDLSALARLRSPATTCVALLTAPDTWLPPEERAGTTGVGGLVVGQRELAALG